MIKHLITLWLLLAATHLIYAQNCVPIPNKIGPGSSADGGGSQNPQGWELQIAHFRGNGPSLEYYIQTVPGTFYSSSYYHHPNPALPYEDLPWVIKQELNPLRNYAKNPGEQWITVDKHFQEEKTTPTLIFDSLVHTFYLYPEKRRQFSDEAKPQSSGSSKNNESNLYPGLYKVTSDKPGTPCTDNAAVYVRLPRGAGGCEKFMFSQGPDVSFVRGGSGFYYEDVENRGPWKQFFYFGDDPSVAWYDNYELTEADYGINDPGINNRIGYTENFITHQLADGPDFWAKRRVVVAFEKGNRGSADLLHSEIMDFLPTRPNLPIPSPPSGFPPDLVRYAREMSKYLEAMQGFLQSLRDSLPCSEAFDLPDPTITPVEFTDDVIAFTKVYEVVNETQTNTSVPVPPLYQLPLVNYAADVVIKYSVTYGLRTYIRYRCFSTNKFTQVLPLTRISLMWHALPDSYTITVYIKRK